MVLGVNANSVYNIHHVRYAVYWKVDNKSAARGIAFTCALVMTTFQRSSAAQSAATAPLGNRRE